MKKSFQPHTNPTDEQLVQMKEQLNRLVKIFGSRGLVYLLKQQKLTVNNIGIWKARGRISALAAHEICKHKDVQSQGFTREGLRPDVMVWYIDDEE